ncbi:MAG TPA: hypothetical protein VNK67_00675 [Burkholderiales bacterium]|nr:hypothetical protein [Burkholderiales bacterium]
MPTAAVIVSAAAGLALFARKRLIAAILAAIVSVAVLHHAQSSPKQALSARLARGAPGASGKAMQMHLPADQALRRRGVFSRTLPSRSTQQSRGCAAREAHRET